MIIEVISTGSELMRGVTDTNFPTIARYLLDKLGVQVNYYSCLADSYGELLLGLKTALRRSDVVILTGGLGPTKDDLTRLVCAEVLGEPLVLNKMEWARLSQRGRRYGVRSVGALKPLAYFPASARLIHNQSGSCAGFVAERDGALLFALPGVPAEMQSMLQGVVSVITNRLDPQRDVYIRSYQTCALTESDVEARIKGILGDVAGLSYGLTVNNRIVCITVYAQKDAIRSLDRIDKRIKKALGDHYFGDDKLTIEESVAQRLVEKRLTLGIAESCTGGLISDKLTGIPGISSVLLETVVCYSDDSKISRLGVDKRLIERHGAVSREVAIAMARGIIKTSGAKIGLASTGIAGPGGGSKAKPVGLVYIAVATRRSCRSQRFVFPGDRTQVKQKAANCALNLLRLYLEKGRAG
jgi:nicotinamide-nucleotide amidase